MDPDDVDVRARKGARRAVVIAIAVAAIAVLAYYRRKLARSAQNA